MKEEPQMCLVGDGEELLTFYQRMVHPERVMGIFCHVERVLPAGLVRLGSIEQVAAFLGGNHDVQEVYCSSTTLSPRMAQRVYEVCQIHALRFSVVLPLVSELEVCWENRTLGAQQLLTVKREPLSYWHNRLLKRVGDMFLVILFLLTLFPLIGLYKIVKNRRRKDGGVLFERRGYIGPDGREFEAISFRGEEQSLARVLDVLLGRMSLVGPAPYPLVDENEMPSVPAVRLTRHGVKAGMTGWAQVRGISEEERLAADIWYVEHWSWWLDLRILVRTLFR